MAAPRFLDRIEPRRRPAIEAELMAEIRAGRSVDQVLAWCEEHEVQVGRSSLASFMREVKASTGGSAEDPALRVRREVQASPFTPIKPPKAQREAEAAEKAKLDDEAPLDHVALLRAQLRAAERISQEEDRGADRVAASKLVLQLARELREVERVGGSTAPQIHFYFPHKVEIEMCEETEPDAG